MTSLIRNGELVDDLWSDVSHAPEMPAAGPVIISLEQWQDWWESLIRRADPIGIRLKSDQHPEIIADDLERFGMIALEFPAFKDGRVYSHARLLRERYGYAGELRAVGDVLLDQLHFMQRVGFNAFDISSETPLDDYRTAVGEFSVFYQPSTDRRETAIRLRHRRAAAG